MISAVKFDVLKSLVTQPSISVVSASATSYTITAGKRQVQFQNLGTKKAWYGDSNVAPATPRGCYIDAGERLFINGCREDFVMYWKCASGETTTIGVCEG